MFLNEYANKMYLIAETTGNTTQKNYFQLIRL